MVKVIRAAGHSILGGEDNIMVGCIRIPLDRGGAFRHSRLKLEASTTVIGNLDTK